MKNKLFKVIAIVLSVMLVLASLVSCATPQNGADGKDGVNGKDGADGKDGANGKSAYELAVEKGYNGTVEEWLASLVGEVGASGEAGANGQSAYEIAVKNGYSGTEAEWLVSLIGKDGSTGSNGKSAYELACESGFNGSLAQWLESLVGKTGASGNDGKNGKSAYDLACENGFNGSLAEWLVSLVGADGKNGANGKSAYELAVENGFEGTSAQWLATLVGDRGADGKSAYEIAVENGFSGSPSEWLTSLVGAVGSNGKSAYDLAVEKGYQGTVQEWLASLVGAKGADGENGANGKSAYQIACDNGYKGTEGEWIASLAGKNGDAGLSAFEIYKKYHPEYVGTEEEWINDYVAGELQQHTVTFDLNEGVAGDGFVSEVVVNYGENVALTVPTREGYVFLGWYTGDSVVDGCFSTTDAVTRDLNLKARWRVEQVTVTFVDYADRVIKIQTLNYGEAAEAPAVESVIGSTRFDSWSKRFDYVTEDITVKALYIEDKYTVTYDTNGLCDIEADAYYCGVVPTRPADPAVPGYTFGGWYLDPAFTEKYSFNYALDSHTTLYARLYANMDGDYMVISTVEDLLAIAKNPAGKYVLANDINLKNAVWTPISNFSGELNGNGYKISNFVITSSSDTGFIVSNSGTIKDLTLSNLALSDTNANRWVYVGGLCAKNLESGVIDNCHIDNSTVKVSANAKYNDPDNNRVAVGGLVGMNSGSIKSSSGNANIDAYVRMYTDAKEYLERWTFIGGIVGDNTITGIVECSSYYGDMVVHCESDRWSSNSTRVLHMPGVGGFVGGNYGSVNQCAAEASITLKTTNKAEIYANLGGFAGRNYGTLMDCHSDSTLYAEGTFNEMFIGGFVSRNFAIINNCYSTSNILFNTASVVSAIGGFVALNESTSGYSASITNSFCIADFSANAMPASYGYFAGRLSNNPITTACYHFSDTSFEVNGEKVDIPESTVSTSKAREELFSVDFLTNTLYFETDIWNIEDQKAPSLKCFN